jgi:hypothetical protein
LDLEASSFFALSTNEFLVGRVVDFVFLPTIASLEPQLNLDTCRRTPWGAGVAFGSIRYEEDYVTLHFENLEV